MRKTSVLLSIIIVILSIFILSSCKKSEGEIVDGYKTTLLEPKPDTNPDDYSNKDNLAIVAYIMSISNFKGETKGEVKAKVMNIPYTQKISGRRMITDEVSFQEAISESLLKDMAIQKYIDLENKKALIRKPDNIDGNKTTWSNENPMVYSTKKYREIYGYLPNQITSYALSEETILEIGEVYQSDNNYKLDLVLDPQKSSAAYAKEVKVYGDADSYPLFSEIKISITFNEKWQMLKLETYDKYKIDIMNLNGVSCESKTVETITYDDVKLNDNDKIYFDSHKNDDLSDENDIIEEEKTALDYLMLVFDKYLAKECYLKADLDVNDNKIQVEAMIDLVNNKYVIRNEDFSIIIENNYLYLEALNNKLKYKLDSNMNFGNLDGFLGEAELEKIGNTVLVTFNLQLGSKELPIVFDLKENGEDIILNKISITSDEIKAQVKLTDKFAYELNDNEYKDISGSKNILDKFLELLKGNMTAKVNAKLNIKSQEVIIKGDVKLALVGGLKLNGSLSVEIAGKKLNISLQAKDDIIYLKIGNELVAKLTLTELLGYLGLAEGNSAGEIPNIKIDYLEERLIFVINETIIDIASGDNNIYLNNKDFNIILAEGVDFEVEIPQNISFDKEDLDYLFYHIGILKEAYKENIKISCTANVMNMNAPLEILIDRDLNINISVKVLFFNIKIYISIPQDRMFVYLNKATNYAGTLDEAIAILPDLVGILGIKFEDLDFNNLIKSFNVSENDITANILDNEFKLIINDDKTMNLSSTLMNLNLNFSSTADEYEEMPEITEKTKTLKDFAEFIKIFA